MKTFEQQITESARRLRHNSDDISTVPPCPISQRRRLSWGWWATPAAAVVGLFIGWNFSPKEGGSTPQPIAAAATDTVVVYRDCVKTIHDTVVKHIRVAAPSPTLRDNMVANQPLPTPDTMGCDIECDGVSYHLLARI